MPTSNPEDFASTLFALRCVTYAALVFQVWEWASGFSFEVNHIWKKAHSSIVKWQYLWSRYLGIVGQIGNTIATGYIHSTDFVPKQFCLLWYIEQAIVCQVLLFSLELSLILRLCALSDSNTRLKSALCALVAAEHVIYTASSVMIFRQVNFNEACLFSGALIEMAIMGCAIGVTQCIIWGLTVQSSRRKRVPLSSLIRRDGSWVFGLVLIVLVGGTANIFALKHRPVFNPFSAFVAVTVSSNCRMIINLEKMLRHHKDAASTIEFTSPSDAGGYNSDIQCRHT